MKRIISFNQELQRIPNRSLSTSFVIVETNEMEYLTDRQIQLQYQLIDVQFPDRFKLKGMALRMREKSITEIEFL